jgi:hypothetical protein
VTLIPAPDVGAQMEKLTRGNLGCKMVIAIDGEPVWEPILWLPLLSNRSWTIYVRSAAQGRRLVASLLAGPLPARLRFVGQETVP